MAKAFAFTLPSVHVVQIVDDEGKCSYLFPPTGYRAKSAAAEINGKETLVQAHDKLLPKFKKPEKETK